MDFDWTISVGGILALVSIVIVLIQVSVSLNKKITSLDLRVEIMWHWFEQKLKELMNGEGGKK